jgi:hypothetical protein
MLRFAAPTSATAHAAASTRGQRRSRRAAFPYRDLSCCRVVNCSSAIPSPGTWPRSFAGVADRAYSEGPGPTVLRSRSASERSMTIPGSALATTPSPTRCRRGTGSPTTGCPDIQADHRVTSHSVPGRRGSRRDASGSTPRHRATGLYAVARGRIPHPRWRPQSTGQRRLGDLHIRVS